MHGFMKNSDYSCTVTMHVQKIQKIATHSQPSDGPFNSSDAYGYILLMH